MLDKRTKINYIIKNKHLCITNKIFDENICQFLSDLSKNLLKLKESKLYPDLYAFAYWCRTSNIKRYKKLYCDNNLRIGLGTIFHITPSNVPTNFAYSFVFGLVAGNSNIIRISNTKNIQAEIILKVIKILFNMHKYKELSASNIFIQYEHDEEITKYYSSYCDARIIWGGNQTINEIRNFKIHEKARDITFPDRYSLAIIDGKKVLSLNENKLNSLINNFYNDTYFMDQNACSSPQLIIWLNDNKNAAKNLFWAKLKKLLVKYELDEASEIDKHTNLCKILATSKNIKKVEIENTKLFKIKIEKIDKKIFEMRGFFGCFVEYDTKNINDIAFLSNNIVQTLSYLGVEKSDILNIIDKDKLKGFDRVVPIGKALEMDMVWDGYQLPYALSRIIN